MQKEVLDFNNKVMLTASSVFYVASLLIFSFITRSGLDIVFKGLLPFLLYLILVFFIRKQDLRLLLLAPLLFPAIFYFADELSGTLAAVNIVIAYIANALFFVIARNEHSIRSNKRSVKYKKLEEMYKQQRTEYMKDISALRRSLKQAHEKLNINKRNFKVSLHSIEDKCKSINFAIGRVYSDKKGGNRKLRESLRIPKELYNRFSELTKYFTKKDAPELMKLLQEIYVKLKNLENSEKFIFRPGTYEDLRLHRDPHGRDKVIDVLASNDRDPVKYYHAEAVDVCVKVGEYLRSII